MKKIVLLLIGLSICLFAYKDFEDKHLKCTLVKENTNNISQREAEGLNEYKIDVLVTKTTLEMNRKTSAGPDKITFEFEKIDNGKDIYTKTNTDNYISKLVAYIVPSYLNDYNLEVYDMLDKDKRRFIYECNEATLLEKTKYKFSK